MKYRVDVDLVTHLQVSVDADTEEDAREEAEWEVEHDMGEMKTDALLRKYSADEGGYSILTGDVAELKGAGK